MRIGELSDKFGCADWALSLNVGQHVSRSLEAAFIENIAIHAARGIVISWGTEESGVNLRSADEVIALFKPYGFTQERGLAEELLLFAGVGYGGPRRDLLVLRRRQQDHVDDDVSESSGVELVVQLSSEKCTLRRTFGLLTQHVMWIAGGCGGIFRREEQHGPPPIFCLSSSGSYKECVVETRYLNMERIVCASGRHIRPLRYASANTQVSEVSIMHAAADHLVPHNLAWRGNAELNAVFYKFARRLATEEELQPISPERHARLPDKLDAHTLWLEWRWLWRTEWRSLLGPRRVMYLNAIRLRKIFAVFQGLAKTLPRDVRRGCLSFQRQQGAHRPHRPHHG